MEGDGGMAFDLTSFLVGLLAGIIGGILGAMLYKSEETGELQERVRVALRHVESIKSTLAPGQGESPELDDLGRYLMQLQDEIRRMYSRSSHR